MNCATKRGVSELKLSKAQSPNISLKVNSEEFPQISSNDETSLNNNILNEISINPSWVVHQR